MKIIFLDHDGVICLSTEWGGRFKKQNKNIRQATVKNEVPVDLRFDNFNKKAIEVLNEILKITDAEIVVSSDWKQWANLEEMGEYYESQGIIKKPIAFTPNINDCTNHDGSFPWVREWDLEQIRALEIKQYLLDHPEVTNWVAVDDLNMGNDEPWKQSWSLENFILTPKRTQGIKQTGIKDKIIKILNRDIQNS